MQRDSLKSKLEEFDFIEFAKSNSILSKTWRAIKFESSDPENFDLKSFNQKIKEYRSLLDRSGADLSQVKIEDVVPKSLEEALALMEAQNQSTSHADRIDVVRKWLASASAANVKKMRALLEFKNDEQPAALYSRIAQLYLLVHAPRESFDYILNVPLDKKAEALIARRASIAFLTNTYEGALDELGIAKATGIKAVSRQAIEDHPNVANFGFNIALGAVEVHFFGLPIFATPRELNLLKAPIEKITEQQRIQIMKGDFKGLDPKLQQRLMRFAKSEVMWRRFLQIAGIVGLIWMMYYFQSLLRHHYSTTLSTSDRERLIDDAIKVFIASNEVNYGKAPSPQEISEQRINFKSEGDAFLEKYVHNAWFMIDEAKKMRLQKLKASGG